MPERARDTFWPKGGWRRAFAYLFYRLARLPGSSNAIAAGFACGAAVSVTPFLGLHTISAILLAWLVRGNIPAAVLGTLVGNPWTLPFIFLGTYRLGVLILRLPEHHLPDPLTMAYLTKHPGSVLLPMTVGCIPVAAATAALAYWPIRRIVRATQARRRERIAAGRCHPKARGERA